MTVSWGSLFVAWDVQGVGKMVSPGICAGRADSAAQGLSPLTKRQHVWSVVQSSFPCREGPCVVQLGPCSGEGWGASVFTITPMCAEWGEE